MQTPREEAASSNPNKVPTSVRSQGETCERAGGEGKGGAGEADEEEQGEEGEEEGEGEGEEEGGGCSNPGLHADTQQRNLKCLGCENNMIAKRLG